ncbi:MAG: phage scaffolding protein [Turicibacter sp.]|nr:phage scaffolding protein [Turicibacter sp.]
MEWIKAILERHVGEDGVLDMEAATAEITSTSARHVVPKKTFNDKLDEIKELKASAGNVEELQKKIQEYEAKEAKAGKEAQIRAALESAGVTDVDYMMYKLGELEAGEDGKVLFLENHVGDLKDKFPKYFTEKAPDGGKSEEGKPDDGFQPISGKLDEGKPANPNQSQDFMNAFTADLSISK